MIAQVNILFFPLIFELALFVEQPLFLSLFDFLPTHVC